LVNETIFSTPVVIIGAGAVGSFTALAMAKIGFSEIVSIDFDSVSDENIHNQFFRIKDIGKTKVQALSEIIKEFSDTDINPMFDAYTQEGHINL
jgi:tRNA A37 threonylcarbamoyladenosine dehydratase